jgi:hypothetical protein
MNAHIQNWRNSFAQLGMDIVDALINTLGEDNQTAVAKEDVAEEITMQLSNISIMDTPEHTYRTFAYEWDTWSEVQAERKVS